MQAMFSSASDIVPGDAPVDVRLPTVAAGRVRRRRNDGAGGDDEEGGDQEGKELTDSDSTSDEDEQVCSKQQKSPR
jgi:hypothetical protein